MMIVFINIMMIKLMEVGNIQMDNLKKLLKEEYNKAIDDCIEELKKRRDTRYMKANCYDVELKMLAEKLKGTK